MIYFIDSDKNVHELSSMYYVDSDKNVHELSEVSVTTLLVWMQNHYSAAWLDSSAWTDDEPWIDL